MAVKRHGSGWRADWRDAFGVRQRKTFALKAEAEEHEREQLDIAREARGGDKPADPNVTFAEYAQKWLGNRTAQEIDPATVARQEVDLRRHLLPKFGVRGVREIRRLAVREFLLEKLADGVTAQGARPGRVVTIARRKKLARGSVKNIYHTLSAVLSEAVEDGIIKANPLRRLWRTLSKGRKAEGKAAVKALDAVQARAFLTAAQTKAPECFPYFATLTWAGLRPGEGLALTGAKLDFLTRQATIDVQIDQRVGVKLPKDGKARKVDLSAPLATLLGGMARRRNAERLADPTRGPWLFFPELGERPTTRDAQRVYKNALRAMRRSLRAAGLPTYFGLHCLRHTYGSGLISEGVSPAYVKAQMGHASISMTVDTYGSWLPVKVPGAVDRLSERTAPAGHVVDTLMDTQASGAA